jgi:tetratricopeptide (TPR) repeat protein
LPKDPRNAADLDPERGLYEEALALRRETGDEAGQATALYNLGCLELDEGDRARGRAMLEEGLALDLKAGDDWGAASDRAAIGVAALDSGNLEEARALFAQAIKGLRDAGDTDRLAEVLGFVAGLAGETGDPIRAARLAGAAEMMWGTLGIPLAPHDKARFERYQEKARAALGPGAFEQARGEGRSMTIDQAIAFALAETG